MSEKDVCPFLLFHRRNGAGKYRMVLQSIEWSKNPDLKCLIYTK